MLTAFFFSSLFLVSYITNHALHGDTYYPLGVQYRMEYRVMLVSHVLLSIVALPLVLVTFFLSLSGRFAQHKRVARWTFPLWLYVSVTGVLVYLWLHWALLHAPHAVTGQPFCGVTETCSLGFSGAAVSRILRRDENGGS